MRKEIYQLTVLLMSPGGGLFLALTVQSFLEPLNTDHVFGQFESLAFRLDTELPTNENTTTSNKLVYSQITIRSSIFLQDLPIFTEKLLLISDVAFVTSCQLLQDQLGIFLVGRSYGSFIGLKLDKINHFVSRG